MQIRESAGGFPLGTVGNCDFVTGKDLRPGDVIVDFDVDIEARQPFGRVCVSGDTIRLAAEMIGWKAPDEKASKKLARVEAELAAVAAERDLLRDALSGILKVRELLEVVE